MKKVQTKVGNSLSKSKKKKTSKEASKDEELNSPREKDEAIDVDLKLLQTNIDNSLSKGLSSSDTEWRVIGVHRDGICPAAVWTLSLETGSGENPILLGTFDQFSTMLVPISYKPSTRFYMFFSTKALVKDNNKRIFTFYIHQASFDRVFKALPRATVEEASAISNAMAEEEARASLLDVQADARTVKETSASSAAEMGKEEANTQKARVSSSKLAAATVVPVGFDPSSFPSSLYFCMLEPLKNLGSLVREKDRAPHREKIELLLKEEAFRSEFTYGYAQTFVGYNGNCVMIQEKFKELCRSLLASVPGVYIQPLDFSFEKGCEVRTFLREVAFCKRLRQSFPAGLDFQRLG